MAVEAGQEVFSNDKATGVVELGPRSLALLRRLVLLLETAYDMKMPDPGPTFETDAQQFGATE